MGVTALATDSSRQRRSAVVLLVGFLAVGMTACGDDIADQSLCTVYGEYLDARATVQSLEPEILSAGEAADVAADYVDAVRRLQEVADDTNSIPLLTLEEAATDILLTLSSIPPDEDYSTWAPLVEDELELAADAAVTVTDTYEAECPQAGDD